MLETTVSSNVASATAVRRQVRIVDCDVHPQFRSFEEFRSSLPEPWRSSTWHEPILRGNAPRVYGLPAELPAA